MEADLRNRGPPYYSYIFIVKNYSGKGKDEQGGTDFVSMYRVERKPDPAHISTSYVERQNLTMRTSMRRFSRKTNAFSKTRRNHKRMVALYFMHYNFCRIHETIGVTPAMEAGITDTLWDESDIVELIDQATPAPGPRGPYNTARKRLEDDGHFVRDLIQMLDYIAEQEDIARRRNTRNSDLYLAT